MGFPCHADWLHVRANINIPKTPFFVVTWSRTHLMDGDRIDEQHTDATI